MTSKRFIIISFKRKYFFRKLNYQNLTASSFLIVNWKKILTC
ncbi:hypothetical protein A1OE_474 [Candidatus Endolissoclinum faulkneri L2]|uniref:Uncharacterized protein n=1 Tax=Candidatus Endolissoclinum faulkneri L2 TaxID=1193729 RepID=K7YMC7_9PROT|nr:hypothetical protein A1OE_474 [Candidatus Endolissoclinum faulkneri L2]